MPKMDDQLLHGCGKRFMYPGAYATHGLKCDGTKPARSRISGGSGSSTSAEESQEEPRASDPPRAPKASAKVSRKRATVKPRKARPVPRTSDRSKKRKPSAAGDVRLLKELKDRAQKIADELDLLNKAIDAIEALP